MKLAKYILFVLIFYSCAVIEAPSGGPKDTTPPSISTQSPKNYSKNFNGSEVEIEFSKFMNRNSIKNAIRINPPVEYEIKWFRKNLKIEFLEELKNNTTYAIQIGASYSDVKGNKPERSNTIVFSTGDNIDSLKIEGIVKSNDPTGMLVYAWREGNYDLDSFEISKIDPDYITELGKSGEFSFEALKPGKYRLLGFFDKNFDSYYSDGIEDYALPTRDVFSSDTADQIILKATSALDRSGPELVSVLAKTRSFLEIKYSEPVLFDKGSLLISDTNSIFKHQINTVYYLDSIPGKSIGVITDPMDTSLAYKFYGTVKDTLSQKIADSLMSKIFRVGDSRIEPSYLLPEIEDSTYLESYEKLQVQFEIPPTNFYDENIKLKLSDKQIPFISDKKNENIYSIKLDSLIADSLYTLEIDLNDIKAITGETFKDSLFKLRFFPPKPKEYNSISGKFIPLEDFCDENLIIRLFSNNNVYQTHIKQDSTWEFEDILPGTYQSEIICDLNNNGKWDGGDPINYILAEKIYNDPQNIEIKARWDLEQIIIKQ